jgi:hypothetical protein
MNMAARRRCDWKVVEEGSYDRADRCNALVPRLCGEESRRYAKGNKNNKD